VAAKRSTKMATQRAMLQTMPQTMPQTMLQTMLQTELCRRVAGGIGAIHARQRKIICLNLFFVLINQ